MRAPILAPILVLVLASATAHAAGIYQWKDAKGVTHYTDTPPPSSEYKQRNIYNPGTGQPTAKPAENPTCTTARNNLAVLNSQQNVQLDSDGDGKPDKTLSDSDRANQLALAQATLNISCTNSAPASVSAPAPASKGG
ncbi:MAG: DUF4124 domain-containing protein [Thermomonas sp.]